jgi:hypothetical protein
MWYDEGESLSGLLSLVIQNHESDREAYWSDQEDHTLLLKILDGVASALLTASGDMVATPTDVEGVPFPWESVRRLADHPELREQVVEKLRIEVAYDSVDRINDAAERCLDLTRSVLAAQPAENVAKFIQRLGRCYVSGFLPECVIICRGVLENAVRERFDRAGVPLPATSQGVSPMRQRLEWAVKAKWLSAAASKDAMVVWQRGNTAVHDDPEATKDVLGTIQMSMRVLQELTA